MEVLENTPIVAPSLPLFVLNPPPNVTKVSNQETEDALIAFLESIPFGAAIGFDVETDFKKDFFWRRLRTVQFGNSEKQFVIDLRAYCEDNPDILYNSQGQYGINLYKAPRLKALLKRLMPFFQNKRLLLTGVNLGFEYMCFYWCLGIRLYNFFDCTMVEKAIWAGAHSLKDYDYYGMEQMFERYFLHSIDKSLQTSFNLEDDLTDSQLEYAAFDTRSPLAIRLMQLLVIQGETPESLRRKGKIQLAERLSKLDRVILGDNLEEIAQIENDAIGAFQDMHIHGERMDRETWLSRIVKAKENLAILLREELDPVFLPIVGSKNETITDERLAESEAFWKAFNDIPANELALKREIRVAKKAGDLTLVYEKTAQLDALETARKAEKEIHKKAHSTLKKKRTAIKNLAAKCEGEALVNYSSDAQLIHILQDNFKKLAKLNGLDDETLEKYKNIPVMSSIRKYHGLAKEIGTYGDQWAMEWVTHPCKEEGWLHPGDGRLHSIFNQYDAETGRSSSERPNGQNLPQDKEVRACFIADPPNKNVRISTCCNADTIDITAAYSIDPVNGPYHSYECTECGKLCETKAEEYAYLTIDMSGAELRIIAEAANDPIWIGAFERDEDVHSVGTEILYPEQWPKLTEDGCAYFKLNDNGEPQRKKCKCKGHNELRNATKAINFLLAYGGGPHTLAKRLGVTVERASELMAIHEARFPNIWKYLAQSGYRAKIEHKSFDLYGRRRLLPEPTQERAIESVKEYREESLQLPEEIQTKNINDFILQHERKPLKAELWILTHREPTGNEIASAFVGLASSKERQGKNHRIQGTNATIAKLAISAGYDKNGKPYLWHVLPTYRAKLVKFVHDELVIQAPKHLIEKVAEEARDAFKRAAAVKMNRVVMESEFKISNFWEK